MKKKSNIVDKAKRSVYILIFAVLLIGWGLTISNLLGDDELEQQNVLIEQAQELLEDKLYVRAVQKYTQALNDYQTERNEEIERKLLSVYFEGGMLPEYYEMLENYIADGRATVEDYLVVSQMYIDEERISTALSLLEKARKLYNDEKVIELSEKLRYEYKIKTLNSSKVKIPSSDWVIPYYNGEKWGFVNSNNDLIIGYDYEDATRFIDGYSVVKIDGIYTLIDKKGYWNAVDKNELDEVISLTDSCIIGVKDGRYGIYSRTFKPLTEEMFDCVYANDNGLYLVQKDGKWAILSSDLEPVTDYMYTDVAVNSKGQVFNGQYAVVRDEQGYFMINQAGEALFTERFSNAKGFEGGYFAVANSEGKWGFANSDSSLVVDYQYEDAKGFSCSLGAVKYAGKWGYINRYNDIIIEPQYEEAFPFIEGIAMATNDAGYNEVLTLKYYELYK